MASVLASFLSLIPKKIAPDAKRSAKDFTRSRKLPFPKLIVFILSLVGGGKSKGVDIKSGEFFRAAKRSGLWPEADQIHRSSLTKARKKVCWTLFRHILQSAVELAYSFYPRHPSYLWHSMSVIAFDGSKYDLPATEEMRSEFDPKSGLQHEGRGHCPQCLVTTAYDVFRRLPIARSVVSIHGSEREQARDLLPFVPSGCVLLFDRGYPSFDFISYLRDNYDGYFLFRCPAEGTFPAVEAFVRSGRQEDYICITPSNNYLKGLSTRQRKKAGVIQLRMIRLVSPEGKISVLLTNLLHKAGFPKEEIIELYFRRWAIEDHYRSEKVVLEIEKFHGKTPNSIRQELFAVVIMSVIARTLMVITSKVEGPKGAEFQFKNAVMTLVGVTTEN
ncbi:IS4 family transposase [Desulfacinum infernum]|uniref:IS4 family transposase n=1 Tax=Desulfacinum infernum TaxID=35837 RepID=UPI00116037FC